MMLTTLVMLTAPTSYCEPGFIPKGITLEVGIAMWEVHCSKENQRRTKFHVASY